jgi:predicted PurR-regulated permease PerM
MARGDAEFMRRLLIGLAVGALALLLWRLLDLLLLVFGAVLVGVLPRALAEPIARRTPLSDGWALAGASLAVLVVIVVAIWLFGAEVRARASAAGVAFARGAPRPHRAGARLVNRAEQVAPAAGTLLSGVAGVVTSFAGGLTDFLLIVFGGLYLAAQPDLYRQGLLLLVPRGDSRERLADTFDVTGMALRRWLLGS